jgi:hypothetical protein
MRVGCVKIDLLNTETQTKAFTLEFVLIPNMDVFYVQLNSLEEAEHRVKADWRSERIIFSRIWSLLSRNRGAGGYVLFGLRLRSFSLFSFVFLFDLLVKQVHFNDVLMKVVETVVSLWIVPVVVREFV